MASAEVEGSLQRYMRCLPRLHSEQIQTYRAKEHIKQINSNLHSQPLTNLVSEQPHQRPKSSRRLNAYLLRSLDGIPLPPSEVALDRTPWPSETPQLHQPYRDSPTSAPSQTPAPGGHRGAGRVDEASEAHGTRRGGRVVEPGAEGGGRTKRKGEGTEARRRRSTRFVS